MTSQRLLSLVVVPRRSRFPHSLSAGGQAACPLPGMATMNRPSAGSMATALRRTTSETSPPSTALRTPTSPSPAIWSGQQAAALGWGPYANQQAGSNHPEDRPAAVPLLRWRRAGDRNGPANHCGRDIRVSVDGSVGSSRRFLEAFLSPLLARG
jgi:hypothetical protein